MLLIAMADWLEVLVVLAVGWAVLSLVRWPLRLAGSLIFTLGWVLFSIVSWPLRLARSVILTLGSALFSVVRWPFRSSQRLILAADRGVSSVNRRAWHWSRRSPLAVVAVIAIVGGFLVLTRHSNQRHTVLHSGVVERMPQVRRHTDIHDAIHDDVTRRVEEHFAELEHRLQDLSQIELSDSDAQPSKIREISFEPDVEFAEAFPFDHDLDQRVETKRSMPRVGLVALGTVLVICGWLLFNRNRTRPGALKAVTLLGLAATGVILFGLFEAPSERRMTRSRDRVVRVSAEPEVTRAVAVDEAPRKARPPSRAKHPTARAKRPVPRDVGTLPPRAGEIPVASELSDTASKTAEPAPPEQPSTPTPPKEPPANKPEVSEDASPAKPEPEKAKAAAPAEPAAAPAADPEPEVPAAPETPEPTSSDSGSSDSGSSDSGSTESNEPETSSSDIHDEATSDAAVTSAPATAARVPAAAARASDTAREHVEIQANAARPDWIDMPGQLVDSAYRVSIKSGLYADVPECQGALEETLKRCVDDYIERLMGAGSAVLVNIDRAYLNQHIKQAEFSEVVISESVGPMHEIHALLEIDDNDRAAFHDRWRRAEVTHRLWYVGSVGVVVLALLSTFYGYLRLDKQIGETHKGRLQLAATLVALIIAAGAFLALGDAQWTELVVDLI